MPATPRRRASGVLLLLAACAGPGSAAQGSPDFQSDLFGKQRMELFAQSPTVFFMTTQDMTLEFPQAGNGTAAAGFVLKRGDCRYAATRAD